MGRRGCDKGGMFKFVRDFERTVELNPGLFNTQKGENELEIENDLRTQS
jgi:hypothetical protein